MAEMPMICEHCGHIFRSGFEFEGSVRVNMRNVQKRCPNCQKMTRAIDGRFSINGDVITFIDGPDISRIKLLQIKEILDAARGASQADIERRIEQETGEKKFITRMSAWMKGLGGAAATIVLAKDATEAVRWFIEGLQDYLK